MRSHGHAIVNYVDDIFELEDEDHSFKSAFGAIRTKGKFQSNLSKSCKKSVAFPKNPLISKDQLQFLLVSSCSCIWDITYIGHYISTLCVTYIGHYISALFNLSFMFICAIRDDCVIDSFYVLTSKVRELLIFVLCVIVFIY